MKTKKAAKKRMGRPPLPQGQRRIKRDFTLPEEVIQMAERLGGGNASAGAEKAIRALFEKEFASG